MGEERSAQIGCSVQQILADRFLLSWRIVSYIIKNIVQRRIYAYKDFNVMAFSEVLSRFEVPGKVMLYVIFVLIFYMFAQFRF